MAADSPVAMLNATLQPWREAVEDPARAQGEVLQRLLADYAKTDHGRSEYGIKCEWDKVPDEAFMILWIDRSKVGGVSGVARFREEFSKAV